MSKNYIPFADKINLENISDGVKSIISRSYRGDLVPNMEQEGWKKTSSSKKMMFFERKFNGQHQSVGLKHNIIFGWDVVETAFYPL